MIQLVTKKVFLIQKRKVFCYEISFSVKQLEQLKFIIGKWNIGLKQQMKPWRMQESIRNRNRKDNICAQMKV
ncbi:unnamed protein product [Paramecium sonneborni]|uniref:Uncharacterized protein n=1 Tax=Paramecium sonneborni TaxID=65129 RepID=A0A8S1LGN7_9CILI|nr:unnamed protein product [Paramecium sonneborni]